jgi:hypothetical protein
MADHLASVGKLGGRNPLREIRAGRLSLVLSDFSSPFALKDRIHCCSRRLPAHPSSAAPLRRHAMSSAASKDLPREHQHAHAH